MFGHNARACCCRNPELPLAPMLEVVPSRPVSFRLLAGQSRSELVESNLVEPGQWRPLEVRSSPVVRPSPVSTEKKKSINARKNCKTQTQARANSLPIPIRPRAVQGRVPANIRKTHAPSGSSSRDQRMPRGGRPVIPGSGSWVYRGLNHLTIGGPNRTGGEEPRAGAAESGWPGLPLPRRLREE